MNDVAVTNLKFTLLKEKVLRRCTSAIQSTIEFFLLICLFVIVLGQCYLGIEDDLFNSLFNISHEQIKNQFQSHFLSWSNFVPRWLTLEINPQKHETLNLKICRI